MDTGFKELLENVMLGEETKTAFLEAWNHKLEEARTSIREEEETKLREEFSSRFAADKSELVEAMDRMLTDAVKNQATQTFEATKALKEERAKLTKAIKEARAEYKSRLAGNLKVVETFVLGQLKSELTELSADHRAVQAQRVQLASEISEARNEYTAKLSANFGKLQNFVMSKLSEEIATSRAAEQALSESKITNAKKLREHRIELNATTAGRINKLEAFVVEHLQKEIQGLEADKNSLVEARVKLISEAKTKMDETRKAFITRASKLVETTVENRLRTELTQLKDDLREAKENLFGRRLFEAFQAEFMTSYLSEGTKVKALTNQLNEAHAAIDSAKAEAAEQAKLAESMQRKVTISEQRASREKTLNELLAPLGREKRAVMANLLESVKTPALKEAFQKYLPTVTKETATGNSNQGRRVLSEAPVTAKRTVAVTGDRNNRLAESARAEQVQDDAIQSEILDLRRLAGL